MLKLVNKDKEEFSMKIDLGGRVAIVTGASRGIGKAIAKVLLQNSAKVIIADILEDTGKNAAEELSGEGVCRFIKTDVTNRDQVKKLIEAVVNEFGKIDIFINNAGINIGPDEKDRTTIDKFTQENWDRLLKVNLTGIFHCSQEISRVMIKQGYGKIVNIGSVFGTIPARNQIAFAASKAGVHNMTKAMAMELAPFVLMLMVSLRVLLPWTSIFLINRKIQSRLKPGNTCCRMCPWENLVMLMILPMRRCSFAVMRVVI